MMRSLSRSSAAMLLTSTLLLANEASGQLVRGRALTPNDVLPVAGAVVLLLDSAGAVVGRTLADERGWFALRAPAGGRYQLRGLRIGYRPSTSDRFAVAATGVTMRSLPMIGAAVVLDVARVVADSRCAAYRDSGTAAYWVWEEARKALISSLLARAESTYEMDVVAIEQRFSVPGDSLLSNTETERHGSTVRPFTAFPAERLAKDGYVTRDASGVLYAGPDEEILLSDGFAETHCMRLEERENEPGTLTLSFTPTAERRLPDIAGRLTIERATGRLRRLDFTYVNVTREELDAAAGGTILFRLLPAGSWIIDRWALRLPVFARRLVRSFVPGSRIGAPQSRDEWRVELVAVQVAGGEVQRIARGSKVLWTGPQAPLLGRLVDSAGAPVPNAVVTVLGPDVRATSDGGGSVHGPMVRPGRKRLRIGVPLLDSLALPPVIAEVVVDSSGPAWLVRLPTRAQWIAGVCANEKRSQDGTGFLRGTTRTADGARLPNTPLVASWWEHSAAALVKRTLTTRSSAIGDYQLCGVPLDGSITVEIRQPDGGKGEARLVIERTAGIAVQDVRIGERLPVPPP